MEMLDIAREIVYCEREYYALSERFRAQVTFQQFVSIKNHRWSKDEVTHWVNIVEENKAEQLDGRKHRLIPHPLGTRNFAIVAKCLGS
jgi:hypothetical protein